MTTYLIELRLNQPDLLLFLEHARMFKASVTAIPEEQKPAVATDLEEPMYLARARAKDKPARAPRAPRKSKINEAIIEYLERHVQARPADLKEYLTEAGLAATSLSNGLSILQKNGTIQRDGHGLYYLSAHEGVAA